MDQKTLIAKLGGPHAVGKMLGITGQAVSQWRRVPVDRAIAIERATNGAVTREELRPDIFCPLIPAQDDTDPHAQQPARESA